MATEFDDPLLRQWHDDDLQAEHAAEWYDRVQQMRKRADYYERSLLRALYFEKGLNWREIAEVLNANLSSRQAARQKWKRLVSELGAERREPGGPGVWPLGKRRNGEPS